MKFTAKNFSIRTLFSKTQTSKEPEKLKPANYFQSLFTESPPCIEREMSLREAKEILNLANSGHPEMLCHTLNEILERDGTICAHLQTRILSVVGKPFSVTSKTQPELAKKIEKILQKIDLSTLIEHLLNAIVFGYAGVVLDWQDGGESLNRFQPIHPACFDFSNPNEICLLDADHQTHAFNCFAPEQFIFLRYKNHARVPSADGIGRTLLWLYLLKKVGLNGWSRFVEKFGMPILLGKLPEHATFEQGQKLLQSLSRMARDGVGVTIGDDSAIDKLESAQSGDTHERYCRYIDELITLCILGQLATSDRANGTSSGNIQGAVRDDIMRSDAQLIIKTIQTQLINPYLKMAYGLTPDAHDVTFWIDTEQQRELTSYAELCAKLASASGCTLDPIWVENEFNIKLQKEKSTLVNQ